MKMLFALLAALLAGPLAARDLPAPSRPAPPTGLLYFASYPQRDNPAPASNPYILGALFTIYWSDVETREGVFDWSALDRRIAVWTAAGKKVALRIMWSSSGGWPEPAAKHPTPQFVLDAGAAIVTTQQTRTQIPLVWDPVYRRHAARFLREVARKFDGDPNVLFIDVTPGAETNPYRFRRINTAEPEFKRRFLEAKASDGRSYSHGLWLETVNQAVDEARSIITKTPLLVTLNVGSLDGPEQFQPIGAHAVGRGCYVGQNGLNARSYDADSLRLRAFREWGAKTRLYFETVDASGGGTGSLMDVMKAAERAGCDYLGVYAVDVLRGTRGQRNYDPAYEAALAYGAKAIGGMQAAEGGGGNGEGKNEKNENSSTSSSQPAGLASSAPQGFRLSGERWTYREGTLAMDGILLKPEGKGPFPAILISHGLGGAAESFGLSKAREFVKWGFVCIAPNYTHNARAGGSRPAGPNARRMGPRGSAPQNTDFGASEENIRRARACLQILRGLPEVDPSRLAAYGHSMGGFVTLGLAAAEPGTLKAAAISGSGVAPSEGFAAPSLAAAARIRTPILILHGGADPVVRPEQSAALKEVLDRNKVENERRVFEGEGHPIDQNRREELFALIRQWFTKQGLFFGRKNGNNGSNG